MNTGFPSVVRFSQKRTIVLDCLLLAVGLFILSSCQANGILTKPQATTVALTLTQDQSASSTLSAKIPSGFCPDALTFAIGFAPAQADETLVVVSNFADPQGNDLHKLTPDLVRRMREMLSTYPNIRVEQLGCAINPQAGSETALRIGSRKDVQAAILIWGVYVTPVESTVRISFTIVKEQESYLGAGFDRSLGPQTIQLRSFDFEANLGAQMNEMATFTSGVVLFNVSEHLAAEPLFDSAISTANLQQAGDFARLIHLYRGVNDLYLGKVRDAKSELEPLQPAKTVTGEVLDPLNLPLLNGLGLAYSASDGEQKALECYDQTLPFYQAVYDKAGEAKSLNSTAVIYAALGDYRKAYEVYDQALNLYQSLGDKAGEVRVLTNLGNARASVHEYQQASEYYDQALRLAQSAGDKAGEARVLDTIGYMLYTVEVLRFYNAFYNTDEEKAPEYLEQALALYQTLGDKAGEAEVHTNYASIYDSLGDKQKELESFQQALALYQTLGDKAGEAPALSNIGDFYTAQEEEQQAQEYYDQAVALYQSLGDKAGEARILAGLGDFQLSSLEQQKALDDYNQALLLYQAASNKAGEASMLNKIGDVYRNTFSEKAIEYYKQALPLYQAAGDKAGEAMTLLNIAGHYESIYDPQQALESMLKAQDIFHATGDRWSEVFVRIQSSHLQVPLKDFDGAAATLEIAIDLATEIDDPFLLSMSLGLLDAVNAERNQ